MAFLNPLNYSLAEMQKFVLALVVGAVSIAAFFVVFPVGFETALTVVASEVFAVIGVFAAKNATPDSVMKALMALLGGLLAVVQLFNAFDPNTVETILAIASQVVLVVGVLVKANAPVVSGPVVT